ncbi:NADPH-dependent FMN reductase [Sulfobacillus harzensis]|uniref:NAD(P)H-dependent oxidoreductase n=1 Tax=Sulfobacillus harzensis TaxID=2729629 RepID=A0A7Y0L4Y2_9FIRM|nr:NAD(P)H-dependent oxidoreductase [Sulfobacillus harzensis]NMP23361.1 NAD(P)H-dependent oxidoreductase [Sulfobacillus harzensis]
MPTLLVIIASTRPGRVGLPVGRWFQQFARQHGAFDVRVADLLELNLPMMDEPKHPRFGDYQNPHTKQWSQIVDAADAVVLVMPEYNYAMTAPLKNALDYLSREWQYKPVGLVSYGGASGGLRAQQMVKLVVTTLKMMPVPESVSIPFVANYIKEGALEPTDFMIQSAQAMLDEMARWEEALRSLRASTRHS